MIKVKICGLNDEASVRATIVSQADYAGFVYYPASKRHLPLERAAQLKQLLPPSIKSVSVVVDPDDTALKEIAAILKPDFLQLHGKETPDRLREIQKLLPGSMLIKALPVQSSDDVAQANRYMDVAGMLLFDARPPELPNMLPGGNGLSFDWALLKNRDFGKPWMLSGGLNADNVREAIGLSGAEIVDVSSSVERAPGVKDAALIESFVKAARTA